VKLSIAMCTYNGAAYLPEQLESIAAQTRLPDELVVCDDRSNDGLTREIVKAFANQVQFPARLFVNRKNLGTKKNSQRAIDRCHGDIIFLCGQDDVWKQNKLARIEAVFSSAPEVGLVFTDAEVVSEDLHTLVDSLVENSDFGTESQALVKEGKAIRVLLQGSVVTGATMAFRACLRPLVLPIPGHTILQEDAWIALIIAAVAPLVFLKEPLIKYRQHAGQQIGVSIKGSKYEHRDSPLLNAVREIPYPAGEIHAFKTAYARLVTKCSGLATEDALEAITSWITRLENEKAVLENEAAPAEVRKDWVEMQQYLDSRIIRVDPYIRADLRRLWYRLRPWDIQGVIRAIRSNRRQGISGVDKARKD
jgi:glycosyltransferase involved in cell wall biosynthesis